LDWAEADVPIIKQFIQSTLWKTDYTKNS
jgi:hypothetical protein